MNDNLSERSRSDINRTAKQLNLTNNQTAKLRRLIIKFNTTRDLDFASQRHNGAEILTIRKKAIQSLSRYNRQLTVKDPQVLSAFYTIQELDDEQRNLY